jgi:hypothetical protein
MVEEDFDAEYAVYTLKITRDIDGEVFYYVGMSSRLFLRLSQHLRPEDSQPISMPVPGEKRLENLNYTVEELVGVIECEGKAEAEAVERETYLGICLDFQDTNVLGGK